MAFYKNVLYLSSRKQKYSFEWNIDNTYTVKIIYSGNFS